MGIGARWVYRIVKELGVINVKVWKIKVGLSKLLLIIKRRLGNHRVVNVDVPINDVGSHFIICVQKFFAGHIRVHVPSSYPDHTS